jgi:hypothetical protein
MHRFGLCFLTSFFLAVLECSRCELATFENHFIYKS